MRTDAHGSRSRWTESFERYAYSTYFLTMLSLSCHAIVPAHGLSMTHGMHAHACQLRAHGGVMFPTQCSNHRCESLGWSEFACGDRRLDLRMRAPLPCSHVEAASRPPLNTGMASCIVCCRCSAALICVATWPSRQAHCHLNLESGSVRRILPTGQSSMLMLHIALHLDLGGLGVVGAQ